MFKLLAFRQAQCDIHLNIRYEKNDLHRRCCVFSPTSYKMVEFIVVGQKTEQLRMGGKRNKLEKD